MPRFAVCQAAALAVLSSALWTSEAFAVSASVRMACRGDYKAYCAHFQLGSQEVRACMRANGARLSPGCRSALINSGEASPGDVARFRRENRPD